jgi:hypothetical protein
MDLRVSRENVSFGDYKMKERLSSLLFETELMY